MARMKRVVNRYGKVTLASLGGCLVSIGTFLIVLSSLTVTNVARADEECVMFSTYQSYPWGCTAVMDENGQTTGYCCRWLQGCSDTVCNDTCRNSGGCTEPLSCKQGSVQQCHACKCKDVDPSSGYECKCE